MQKLINPIESDVYHRKAVLKMYDAQLISVIDDISRRYIGHSPYALEKITVWLRYHHHMTINDIVRYLSSDKHDFVPLKLHRNSWVRWSTPNKKGQTTNMHYETWVLLERAVNPLLLEYDRSVADFTYEPTYTPAAMKALREALRLSHDDFSMVVGLASSETVFELEREDISINSRGIGFEDWANILHKLKQAQLLKKELQASPVQLLRAD